MAGSIACLTAGELIKGETSRSKEETHVQHLCLTIISNRVACIAPRDRPIAGIRHRGGLCSKKKSKSAPRGSYLNHCSVFLDALSLSSCKFSLKCSRNVCHWVFNLLHRLWQFAARVNRRRKCGLTLQCLRNSQ